MVVKKGKQSFLAPATCNLSPATWTQWQPTARTCLCFVLRGEEILLIRKKRGIGAGKINGPGGHLEPGETPLEAAVREVQEELGITPINLKQVGELSFQFVDEATGLPQQFEDGVSGALHTVVFIAEDHVGEPVETEEAIPHWFHHTKIPFHEMWEDDQHWLPGMLAQIFNTPSTVAWLKQMNTALSLNFDQSSMCSYSPDQNSSSSLSHQLFSAPRDEVYETSELEGKKFKGYFHFDGDKMLSNHVEWD